MDRYKFRCKYCQGTRLKKSNAGGYACGDCGRQPDTMIPSSMVVNESYVKSAANVRSRGFVVEKVTAEKQVSINDLEHHLEEKWLDYLQYFQEALKYNITHLQQRLALDPKVKEITKKIWLKYLDKWSQSKRRIVSFFSVPRQGLYKESDPTYPKRKYDFDLEEIDELSDLEDEEDLDGEQKQEKLAAQTFNFDFIFSQMTQTSTQITTNKEEQKAKDKKKKDDKDKFKESRSEFYSAKYWARRKDDEREKLKKKRRKNSEHHEIKEVKPKEHSSQSKKKSGFAKDLFSETPVEFLKNLHNHYANFTANTITQIIEDYNQILNFHKGDRKEKIRSIKRRASYLKVDHLQELLKERKIEPETLKLCHSRQAFQKMAKDLVFIHDFFCFTVYRHAELEPIPFSNIEYHIKELAEKESDEDDEENMDEQKKKEEALIKLAKGYIAKHLANKEEALRPKKKPAQKLFALEFNLIPLICFVALRLANYPVFPRDIVQWIKYQILPFFTAHLNIPCEGLKEYLIKPLNIPSSSWIRASYKKFIKVYEIESAITPIFAEKLMERVFLDCEIPYPLLKPCVHLYEFLNLIRKDNLAKPIDEDLVILSVILGTLRLFYGFDDNFYGVFLKMGKVEEASQTLQDEGLKHDLLNMINTFSKHQNRNPTMKCYTSIPKFDNMVQKFQEKISQRKFDHYFQVDGIPFAWDYKDLKDVNKDNIMTYLDITRRSMYPEENQSEFIKLQNYFERINLKDGEDMETAEQNTMINTRIEVNKDLFANGKNCSKQRTVSKFFSEEIKFFLKHSSEKTTMEVDQEETVDLPLPCDNYFVYKKLKSIPHEKIKHEFLFLLDVFSTYLREPVEDIQKGLKFVDKNLVKLVSMLED